MTRDELIAKLAERRVEYVRAVARSIGIERSLVNAECNAQRVEKRIERLGGAGGIVLQGERAKRLRDARGRLRMTRRTDVAAYDRRNDQVFESREPHRDIHPLASIPFDELVPTPATVLVHRLSGEPK